MTTNTRQFCDVEFNTTIKLSFFIIWFLLILLSAQVYNAYQTHINAQQQSIQPAPTVQDKMVEYMRSINPALDFNVAYSLADSIITESVKYSIPVNLQLGLITIESHFDQYALSKVGAQGFYQVMPNWHADKVFSMLKTNEIRTKNIYDPLTNSAVGAKILHDCLNAHKGKVDNALLCYNGSQKDRHKTYAKAVLTAAEKIDIHLL